MTPFTATMVAELVVAIAIILGAAVITNMGAISAAIQNIGWFQ